jgi:hypothetical protein
MKKDSILLIALFIIVLPINAVSFYAGGQYVLNQQELEPNYNITFNATNTLLDVPGPRFNAYVTEKVQRPCCATPPIDILFIAIDKDMKTLQGLVRDHHPMIEYLESGKIICLELEEGEWDPVSRQMFRDDFRLINVGVCLK